MAERAKKPSTPASRRYGTVKPIKAGGRLRDFTTSKNRGLPNNVSVTAIESREPLRVDDFSATVDMEEVGLEQHDEPLTFVPDITDSATYRNILSEIQKDLLEDQRSTQWSTLRSMLRVQHGS